MKTILTALRDEDKVVDETAGTIARALGGTTIATALSAKASDDTEPETPENPETPETPNSGEVIPGE